MREEIDEERGGKTFAMVVGVVGALIHNYQVRSCLPILSRLTEEAKIVCVVEPSIFHSVLGLGGPNVKFPLDSLSPSTSQTTLSTSQLHFRILECLFLMTNIR